MAKDVWGYFIWGNTTIKHLSEAQDLLMIKSNGLSSTLQLKYLDRLDQKANRGRSKISLTMREFLFELLNQNREKLIYMIWELTPRQFVDIYLRLIPFIISQRHLHV